MEQGEAEDKEGGGVCMNQPDNVGMTTTSCCMQWCPALIILYVNIGLQLYQLLDHVKVIINAALHGERKINSKHSTSKNEDNSTLYV